MAKSVPRSPRSLRDRTVGLEDVARAADVSMASVSRVLNGSAKVSDAIRARIERACAELGYVPNGAARALSSRRTRAIGAVVPAIENSGFAIAVAALQKRIEQAGYTLLLASSGYDPEVELREVTALLTHGVDGLVLVGDQHHPSLMPMLKRMGTIFVETWTLSPNSPCVGFDNEKAAGQVIDYLVGLGHTAISTIMGRPQMNDRAAARVAGVEASLRRRGLSLCSQFVVEHPFRILDGRLAMRALLSSDPCPTAVVCGNDQLAFGALIEAASLNVSVPNDISITGFNDLDYAAHLVPPLTTLRIPVEQIGAMAGDYIVRRLQNEPILPMAEVEVSLIVRGSTAPPPGKAAASRRKSRIPLAD
ncbi:LacI family transcriptional regulator [Ancylobacter aquaticus]|uniref:LacI family transcriptional regulator n=1 Tax=Ancylobacter aquaticus TaxID=100 RepID=A0A4R1I323_ANCAQ|nr:LacI family DNA-binding transcriptional regulator [Ancylobacter aquaticus]TCK29178.1 LacI family transcriptional regulator [Ancylobacter aquaticus]